MMEIEASSLLRSARLLSRVLQAVLGLAIATGVGLVAWLVASPEQVGRFLAESVGYADGPIVFWQSTALVLLVLVQLGIWAAVTWRGRQIFDALGLGKPSEAALAANRVARLLWVMLAWGVVAHTLGSVIASANYPPGERALAISLGSAQISTLIAALLATFMARAFVLGAALWQDHKEVI